MKICLIAPIPPFRGGIAKYCHSLAQELEKRHDLLLLSYHRQYPALLYGRKPQLDPAGDVAQVRGEFRRVSFDLDSLRFSTWREAVRRIDAFAPDLVILPWWVTYWTPLYAWLMRQFRRRGISCLVLCINVYDHEDSAIKKLLARFILRRAELLIVHSEQELAELRAITPAAIVRKQLLPVFSYGSRPPLRPDACSLNLLFFGFVRSYKGLDLLLRAMALVADLDVRLKVVGEFWNDKNEYLALIAELGISDRVEVIDSYVSDEEMASFFHWADLAVLPYRSAKTSGVIATAYGFGTPVLATDVGGFGEVVADGSTGRLVRAGDPAAIADGIRWFSDNRQVEFGKHIASFVAQRMSWGALVTTIEEMAAEAGGHDA